MNRTPEQIEALISIVESETRDSANNKERIASLLRDMHDSGQIRSILRDGTSVAVSSMPRNHTMTVDSIADLRQALTAGVSADVYVVRWHTSRAGGGGGRFLGSAIGALVDDGGCVITGGSLAASREVQAGTEIDPRWFGALCSGVDESAMQQAAITYARDHGHTVVHLPPGLLIGTSVDCTLGATSSGLTLRGKSRESVVRVATSGKPAFDFTGNGGCTIERVNLQCIGADEARAPSCHVLFSRNSTNGSAGQHTLKNARLTGACTIGLLVSLSSEVNSYENVIFDDRSANTTAVVLHEQNYVGATSDYETLPVTYSGGNTVHNLNHCTIVAPGGTGRAMSVSGALDLNYVACHWYGTGAAGLIFEHVASQSVSFVGGGDELATTHGIVFGAGLTIDRVSISGRHSYGDLYGEDTSVVSHLTVTSSECVPGCSFYDLRNSRLQTNQNGNPVVVRHEEIDVSYQNVSYANHAAPVLSHGVVSNRVVPCGDAKTRYYSDHGIGTKDRMVTHAIVAKCDMTPIYTATYASTWAPDTDNGQIQLVVLMGDCTVSSIAAGDWNPGIASEPNSAQITLIFIQDENGGHVVTFSASFMASWTPVTTANCVNIITFRYVVTLGHWVQMSASVGLS